MSTPMRVTAHLVNGYVAADDWTPALDGILAWAMLRRDCPEVLDVGVIDGPPIEPELPVKRLGMGDDWYYACSSPVPALDHKHVIHYHKRFDDQYAEHLDAGKRRKVNASSGRYKSYRLMGILRVTPSVSWYLIGDPAGVRELLDLVQAIGEKRAHGYGVVQRWDVDAAPPLGMRNLWWAAACKCRPLPVVSQDDAHGGLLVMTWGIRPPAWWVGNQRLCQMPRMELLPTAARGGCGGEEGGRAVRGVEEA
jgi:CRISPR type IV-associated protein Csf3